MNVQLRRGGFSYDLYQSTGCWLPAANSKNSNLDSVSISQKPEARSRNFHRIDFDLIGSNPNCEIITYEPSSDYLNYYTTGTQTEGVTNIRTFKSVTYKNIYINIDLEFIADDVRGFKYNFVIHPGGNLSLIKMKITDPEIKVSSSRSLILKNTSGTIEEAIPESYFVCGDVKKPVKVYFKKIVKNEFGLGSDDEFPFFSTLIIDPIPYRIWGTYYGGSDADNLAYCALDQNGNVFLGGTTWSTNNIATAGAYQSTISGGTDGYLVKFNSDGVRQWGTYYGGTDAENVYTCVTDHYGNSFIGGQTYSYNNIATPGACQTTFGGLQDGFLAKFNTAGLRQWGTYYGGTDIDYIISSATDDNGDIYITEIGRAHV